MKNVVKEEEIEKPKERKTPVKLIETVQLYEEDTDLLNYEMSPLNTEPNQSSMTQKGLTLKQINKSPVMPSELVSATLPVTKEVPNKKGVEQNLQNFHKYS